MDLIQLLSYTEANNRCRVLIPSTSDSENKNCKTNHRKTFFNKGIPVLKTVFLFEQPPRTLYTVLNASVFVKKYETGHNLILYLPLIL
jgi:hypothetical protein